MNINYLFRIFPRNFLCLWSRIDICIHLGSRRGYLPSNYIRSVSYWKETRRSRSRWYFMRNRDPHIHPYLWIVRRFHMDMVVPVDSIHSSFWLENSLKSCDCIDCWIGRIMRFSLYIGKLRKCQLCHWSVTNFD